MIQQRYDGVVDRRAFENVMTGIVIPKLSKVKDPEGEMNQAFKVRGHV